MCVSLSAAVVHTTLYQRPLSFTVMLRYCVSTSYAALYSFTVRWIKMNVHMVNMMIFCCICVGGVSHLNNECMHATMHEWMNEWRKLVTRAAVEQVESEARVTAGVTYRIRRTSSDRAKSQCSTLVRNTVVRATFKVNGKPPFSGGRSPLTPWPID